MKIDEAQSGCGDPAGHSWPATAPVGQGRRCVRLGHRGQVGPQSALYRFDAHHSHRPPDTAEREDERQNGIADKRRLTGHRLSPFAKAWRQTRGAKPHEPFRKRHAGRRGADMAEALGSAISAT